MKINSIIVVRGCMETKIIYYVHGTTYDNATKKCSGWKQVELNDLGKEQAVNLGKNVIYNKTFEKLFSALYFPLSMSII